MWNAAAIPDKNANSERFLCCMESIGGGYYDEGYAKASAYKLQEDHTASSDSV